MVGVVAQGREEPPVVQRRREMAGHRAEQLDVVLAETAPAREPVMRLDDAEKLVGTAQRHDQGFLRAAVEQCGADVRIRFGDPEMADVRAGQAQQRVVGTRIHRRQFVARDDHAHGVPLLESQPQHDPAGGELVLDPLGDGGPLADVHAADELVRAAGRTRRGLLARAGDHQADVGKRLHVALFAQQVGIRPVQRGQAEEHGEHQRPRLRRVLDDEVAGKADRGVDEADDQDPCGEPDRGADAHAAPQHANRGQRQQRAHQRRGERARQRGDPRDAGAADGVRNQPGHGERAGDLEQERARVVEHAPCDLAGEQRADTGDQMRGQHHFERRDEETDYERDLGERDRP